jgi:hypothetical protein
LARRNARPPNLYQRPRWKVAYLHRQIRADGLNSALACCALLRRDRDDPSRRASGRGARHSTALNPHATGRGPAEVGLSLLGLRYARKDQ